MVVQVDQSVVRVKVVDGSIAVKVQGVGIQGPRGTQLIMGTVPPTPEIGMEGDQYINKTTAMLYGPKIGLDWGVPTSIGGSGGSFSKVAVNIGNGVTKTWQIDHGLGVDDVIYTIREVSTGEIVFPAVFVDTNHVTVTFDDAPATNQYRLVVS
jgi:hypothetical protein